MSLRALGLADKCTTPHEKHHPLSYGTVVWLDAELQLFRFEPAASKVLLSPTYSHSLHCIVPFVG